MFSRMSAELPESRILVGLQGRGARVTLGSESRQFKELPLSYHKGGRTCSVEYESIALGGKQLPVPVRVEVRGPDKTLLRSARMMDFHAITLTPDASRRASAEFAGFNEPYRAYRRLLVRYWQKPPKDVAREDIVEIRRLIDSFDSAPSGGENLGEALRRRSALMELNRILGDAAELERNYRLYLSTLHENKLFDLVLVGGYCAIDTLVLWGRTNEATRLLDLWLMSVGQIDDVAALKQFAKAEMKKGNSWAAIKVLEIVLRRSGLSTADRFEATAGRCLAMKQLRSLHGRDNHDGRVVEAQLAWADSMVSREKLQQMLDEGIINARRRYAELEAVSPLEEELMKRVENQAKAMGETPVSPPERRIHEPR